VAAVQEALAAWQAGRADWVRDWDAPAEDARLLAGVLLGCPSDEVALVPAVSVGVGIVAASLTADDEVVVPDDEFTSVLYPLLVAQEARGFAVRRVPFDAVAESVGENTTLVATSHVRSNGGGRQDLDAVIEATAEHGALILLDATHSAGVLEIEAARNAIDYVVCAAYKHLLCPRGVAFLRVTRKHWGSLRPYCASWRSSQEPYSHYYGGGLDDLGDDARRFDVSLAWHAWFGARESLRVLASVDPVAREKWTVGLASSLAARLGLTPTGSSILGIPVRADLGEVVRRLAEASIVASLREGNVRVSFHLYNEPDDVELVGSTLEPIVSPSG
jgi:selenocysteine lyase/cysteine desulfurase